MLILTASSTKVPLYPLLLSSLCCASAVFRLSSFSTVGLSFSLCSRFTHTHTLILHFPPSVSSCFARTHTHPPPTPSLSAPSAYPRSLAQGLGLKQPEVVPFRLTNNMEDGMGVSGCEGVFRRVFEGGREWNPFENVGLCTGERGAFIGAFVAIFRCVG